MIRESGGVVQGLRETGERERALLLASNSYCDGRGYLVSIPFSSGRARAPNDFVPASPDHIEVFQSPSHRGARALHPSWERISMSRSTFQSPSHRGERALLANNGTGQPWAPVFQSPSHRGERALPNSTRTNEAQSGLFQSPSHRGERALATKNQTDAGNVQRGFNPLLIGASARSFR